MSPELCLLTIACAINAVFFYKIIGGILWGLKVEFICRGCGKREEVFRWLYEFYQDKTGNTLCEACREAWEEEKRQSSIAEKSILLRPAMPQEVVEDKTSLLRAS